MNILDEDLAALTELDNLRREARQLRESGKNALKCILNNSGKAAPGWEASEDMVEAALLVKIQAHRHIGRDSHDAKAHDDLISQLLKIKLKEDLFINRPDIKSGHIMVAKVPILTAARIMQSLVTTSEYAFSSASLLCYYRIVREIQSADSPNWTIGGAKAGKGGNPTAFITGECIRAILSFERTHRDTATFFGHTHRLYKEINKLTKLDDKKVAGIQKWQDAEIERIGLEWFTSTEVRLGEIALNLDRKDIQGRINRKYLENYLDELPANLTKKIEAARKEFVKAREEIKKYRKWEIQSANTLAKKNAEIGEIKKQRLGRSESAHFLAERVIIQAIEEAEKALIYCEEGGKKTLDNLEKLSELFNEIADRIHKVAEPAKRFVESVLNRELAAASAEKKMDWDARELVFAAASYGAATRWLPSERLKQACILLSESISQRGTFPSGQPFLLMSNGFVLHPIAFEVIRCFAQLTQHVDVPIKPQLVHRLLYLFREHKSVIKAEDSSGQCGWCFEDPLVNKKPSIWVSVTAVMALNRIVRMLNAKINTDIFKYFSVKIPEKSLTGPTLQQLIYPDYGLMLARDAIGIEWENSIAIILEQMRAHVLRTKLPAHYNKYPIYSALFYGPPGTGKTTLLEALALSSNVPLIEISPSDIVVSGQELIESRARAVFELLSMLDKVVIALDEFEPILYERKKTKEAKSIFTFVTPAMLPKLKKLHDAAKQQGIVYCLVTNHHKTLDKAAIRKGRFDHHIGIYDMDLLSRTGVFLNKIFTEAGIAELTKDQYERFAEVIKLLSVVSIDEAVKEWFKIFAETDPARLDSPYAYILKNSKEFKSGVNFKKAEIAYNEKYLIEDSSKAHDRVKKWLENLELEFKNKGLERTLSNLERPNYKETE